MLACGSRTAPASWTASPTAAGEERSRLWRLATGVWPDYDLYQEKTDREIPVVVIEPV